MRKFLQVIYRIFTTFLHFMVILKRCFHIAMKLINSNNSLEEKENHFIDEEVNEND